MSMGPQNKERFEVSKFERTLGLAKRAQEAYFGDPIHYLFYGSLGLVIIALFFNLHLPWQLYAILGGLGAIKTFQYFKSSWQQEKP